VSENEIFALLDALAESMDERECTLEGYNSVFPRGTVQTPIGEVKLGKNQYAKLMDKDKGNRRYLLGAMRQTLENPVIIITEKQNGSTAWVFIKSFRKVAESEFDTVLTIVASIENSKVAISTYKRKKREVRNKIKRADGIVYIKDNGGSPTNGI
jgi:hypothetical protein